MPGFEQFELIEPFVFSNYDRLPHSLRLDKNIKEEATLYRLLIGTLDIKNNITGDFVKQKHNYSILGKKIRDRFSLGLFTDTLSASAKIQDLDKYFTIGNHTNKALFKDLINEYCFYYYYTFKNNHTLAFLHVYRILERISYTFPMLYASKARDYVGTFNKLQNFFKGSNSELKFFNLFISDFFETEFLDYKVKINITAYNEEIRKSYYKILHMLCTANDPAIGIEDSNQYTDITIKNKDTINLLIHLRNRYFHFASGGQRNLSSSEMIEPNDFYQIINDHFINWLSVVYFQILKTSI
jgi:hypothetical protein